MKLLSWLIIPIFLLTAVQFTLSNIKLLKFPAQDFEVFYLSGKQVLKTENPYLKLGQDIVRNPPPTIIIFSLLPLLPILTSQAIWFIVSFLTFLVASFFLFKILEANNWKIWLTFLSLSFLFFPFRYNLGSGQVNNLLFLLIVLAFYFTKNRKIYKAAISVALAIAIKITPLFFLLVFLFQKKIKQFFCTLISLGILLLVTSPFLTFNIYKYYFSISNSYLDFTNESYYNQSLAALINRLVHNPNIAQTIVVFISIMSILVFSLLITKVKQNLLSDIIIWNISILYILILAPFAWQYHFVIIIFPLVTTAYLLVKGKMSYSFYLLLGLSYFMIGWNIKNPQVFEKVNILGGVILSHVVLGAILLLLLNYSLLKKLLR